MHASKSKRLQQRLQKKTPAKTTRNPTCNYQLSDNNLPPVPGIMTNKDDLPPVPDIITDKAEESKPDGKYG